MSGSKRISELTVTATLSGNDRVVVLTNPASSAQTQTTTFTNLTNSLRYANTTVSGVVKVGNNLSINATGFLNAQIANTIANSVVNSNGSIVIIANSSGDGAGFSTIELIPDTNALFPDQKIVIDPTGPNHIHIRAGGQQDNSGATLYLGGENSNFGIASGTNPPAFVSANGYVWEFDTTGNLHFPNDIIVAGQGMGPTIVSNTSLFFYSYFDDSANNNIEYYQGSISYPNTYQIFSESYSNSGLNAVKITLDNTAQSITFENSNDTWAFAANGILSLPNTSGDIYRDGVSVLKCKPIKVIDTTAPYTVTSIDEVVICDPNAAAGDITINFPNTNVEGKVFTVKNINAGSHNCFIEISDLSSRLEIPGTGGSLQNNTNIDSSGQYITWIYCNGAYRCIGSGT